LLTIGAGTEDKVVLIAAITHVKMSTPAPLPRRTFLCLSLAGAGLLAMEAMRPASAANLLAPNVTGLYTVAVAKIAQPSNTNAASLRRDDR